MKNSPSISIFFPAYNEEKNISTSIEKALNTVQQITDTYEVIVVDDGSKDKTSEIVQRYAKNNPHVRLIQHSKNKGYGDALKSGIGGARYDYIFFTDSDLQFDLDELKIFATYIPQYDTVIGYRKNRNDPFIRIVNAKLWNIANRILFGLKVKDIDCAFKLLRRDMVQKISILSGGAMISAEMLIKLDDLGITIKELPVTHFPRTMGSQTGANIHVIIRAFKEMWKLFLLRNGMEKI
jgi:glycosyltransferase involved in cell wall biosynthesis